MMQVHPERATSHVDESVHRNFDFDCSLFRVLKARSAQTLQDRRLQLLSRRYGEAT